MLLLDPGDTPWRPQHSPRRPCGINPSVPIIVQLGTLPQVASLPASEKRQENYIFGIFDPLPPPCQYQTHETSLPTYGQNLVGPSPSSEQNSCPHMEFFDIDI